MDMTTAMPLPGEYGDSATDLPFKRLCLMPVCMEEVWTVTVMASVLGPTNIVCSATLYSCFCGGICSSHWGQGSIYPVGTW